MRVEEIKKRKKDGKEKKNLEGKQCEALEAIVLQGTHNVPVFLVYPVIGSCNRQKLVEKEKI